MPPVKKKKSRNFCGSETPLPLFCPDKCIKSISVLFKHPKMLLGVPGRTILGGREE